MIVADANLIVYAVTESPHRIEAQALLTRDPDWIAPNLWRSEFLNAILGPVRQGQLPLEHGMLLFAEAEGLVFTSADPPAPLVLRLASDYGLTAYDATYVALAQQMSIPLITYDRQILQTGMGVHPQHFPVR